MFTRNFLKYYLYYKYINRIYEIPYMCFKNNKKLIFVFVTKYINNSDSLSTVLIKSRNTKEIFISIRIIIILRITSKIMYKIIKINGFDIMILNFLKNKMI